MRVAVSQFEGIDATPALPLAAGCLVAAARADGEIAGAAELSIAFERRPIAEVVAGYRDPDVLGFSLYPWNAGYSLAVAAAAREAYPDCLIVTGGPSAPRRPESARRFLDAHPAVDLLVAGEGELCFREILRAHLHGTGFAHIGGVAVARRQADASHEFTAAPRRILDFPCTASPFLDGTFEELCERHRDRFTMALLETNRGCPFSCTFCDWSLTKQVVEFPIERVHAELEWVAAQGFQHIMMADANFGIRPRDPGIARYLAALRRRTGRPSSFYFYLTKNDHARNLETIEILREAEIGCWVSLSVQDFDPHVLDAVKRSNIQTDESMKLRQACAERGIPTFNELILGLPGQTYESFTSTVAQAMPAVPRHDFVLFLCRLIDNAELGSPEARRHFGLETRRCCWKTSSAHWDPIVDEVQEIVVATRDLPLADWRRAHRFSFFAAALYNLRLLRLVLQHVAADGASLRDYVAHLADRLVDAPPGTVYGELGAIADAYERSLLADGPFVLPLAGDEAGPPVYLDEALAGAALRHYDRFLAETERHTRAFLAGSSGCAERTLGEAFRFQSLIVPRWGRSAPAIREFGHDWPEYVAGGSGVALRARPTRVRYAPPPFVSVPSFASFLSGYVGCLRMRLDVGETETGYGEVARHAPCT